MMSFTVQAQENDFSTSQKEKINQMIRTYILEHPEILPEAIQILQNRSKKAKLAQNYTALYEDGFSYVGGNKNGDVTMIEFFDYNCGYCKRALKAVERLKKEDKNLRIVYKEFPILSESSYTAAKAAMAAIKQGKYEEFHVAMLSNSGKLTEDRIFEIAKETGLDVKQLAKDMTSPIMERNIKINHNLAQALDITGTPGFIIGDTIVPGALPYEELVKLIKKARQQKSP
ncbi:MAG: DsbA family protein [Alphaproteobacteria bacterium]|nr:DsbA family protein [Alphaproteobacteria bacterium]